jgi:hypothetical protein
MLCSAIVVERQKVLVVVGGVEAMMVGEKQGVRKRDRFVPFAATGQNSLSRPSPSPIATSVRSEIGLCGCASYTDWNGL